MNEQEQWNKYLEWSYEEFFSSIKDHESVLELGPGAGHHSKLILRQDPSWLKLVEPDISSSVELVAHIKKLSIQNVEVSAKTYEEFYTQSRPFDVVVCCGLLYHLLAPLHLLEHIVNLSWPKRIILSNIKVESEGIVPYEYDNKVLGRSRGAFDDHPINYWQPLPSNLLKEVLETKNI